MHKKDKNSYFKILTHKYLQTFLYFYIKFCHIFFLRVVCKYSTFASFYIYTRGQNRTSCFLEGMGQYPIAYFKGNSYVVLAMEITFLLPQISCFLRTCRYELLIKVASYFSFFRGYHFA